ncbi:unnamed protein product [Trifolium pratense]|uniref:Uncharacterized protein n=1 Tax=Trifolium pratense TaxID=57577 RepID=A0ACB0LZV1_TRIPR|nr:unnamed protein product [Trifolium pratense]
MSFSLNLFSLSHQFNNSLTEEGKEKEFSRSSSAIDFPIWVFKLTSDFVGASETFFPLCGIPPSNPSSLIVCIGAIPDHYVYVKLKDDCPIPPTCIQWKRYCSPDAIGWESFFVARHAKFDKLMKEIIVDNKKKIRVGSNSDDPIEL